MARYPQDLVSAASSGDRAAIELLLAHAKPDIRRYARQKCRTTSDAEDAVQETLFVLYRQMAALRPIGSMAAWLATVVFRHCLRLMRLIVPIGVDVTEADNAGQLQYRPDAELRYDLARVIESLPVQYRTVVLLRDLDELTIDEIGVRVGASREAVKARLHRGRALLREYLKG